MSRAGGSDTSVVNTCQIHTNMSNKQLTYNTVNGTFIYYGINAHKEPVVRSLTADAV